MKKIVSVLLFILMIFSISACNKSNNTSSELDTSKPDASQSKATDSTDILENFELGEPSFEIQLEELKSIIDYSFSEKLFITSDGLLYRIGRYSDGTNLKKISEEIKCVKFRKSRSIVSDDNSIYTYDSNNFSLSFLANDGKDHTNYSFVTLNSAANVYKATLKSNEIYLNQFRGEDIGEQFKIHSFAGDEIIENFINGTIKTNKGYYYFKQTINHSEYDDVPDTITYSLEKITVLDDDIIFIKYYENTLCIVDNSGHLKIYNNVKY